MEFQKAPKVGSHFMHLGDGGWSYAISSNNFMHELFRAFCFFFFISVQRNASKVHFLQEVVLTVLMTRSESKNVATSKHSNEYLSFVNLEQKLTNLYKLFRVMLIAWFCVTWKGLTCAQHQFRIKVHNDWQTNWVRHGLIGEKFKRLIPPKPKPYCPAQMGHPFLQKTTPIYIISPPLISL